MDKIKDVLRRLERNDPFNQKKGSNIESVEDVKPVSKKDVFLNGFLKPSEKLKLIPSAGTMGKEISYRFVNIERDTRVMAKLMQLGLQDFGVNLEDTFILNCYPLGVQLPSEVNAVDVSTRTDILKHLIAMTKPHYENYLFISQPHFVKHLIDEHVLNGLGKKKVGLILGGSWFPQSFSDFIERKIHESCNEALTTISFLGTAETGLGIGYMGKKEIELRKQFSEPNAPMVFRPNSEEYYIEVINGEMAVTVLDETAFPPLYRYLTSDKAVMLPDGYIGLQGFSKDLLVETVLSYFYKDNQIPEHFTGSFFVRDHQVHFCGKPNITLGKLRSIFYSSELNQFLLKKGVHPLLYTFQHYPFHQPLEKKLRYL